MLRRIFRPKKEEITGGSRKSHKEELYTLYSSPTIRAIKSKRIRCKDISRYGRDEKCLNVLIGKPSKARDK
jgi:hypothetical protein